MYKKKHNTKFSPYNLIFLKTIREELQSVNNYIMIRRVLYNVFDNNYKST